MDKQLASLLPLIFLIVIMYFLLIRPQKKREKNVNQMRSTVKVGDEIITIGGICGKVVKTKDEILTIQVGADKTKFEIMRWAVSKVVGDETGTASRVKKEAPEEDVQTEASKKALPKRMKKTETETEAETGAAAEPAEPETAEIIEESETKI